MEKETQPQNPQIQPAQQAPILPSKNNLKILVFILFGLILITGSVYTGLQISKKQTTIRQPITKQLTNTPAQTIINPTPFPSINSPISLTSDWKTYISEDKSFSFKYPSEWIFETKNRTIKIHNKEYGTKIIIGGIPLTEDERKAYNFINIDDAPKNNRRFILNYSTNQNFKDLTLDSLIDEDFMLTQTVRENIDYYENIVIGNYIVAIEIGFGCQEYCKEILFKHNNTIFDSSAAIVSNDNISTLKQILSTFKFTN